MTLDKLSARELDVFNQILTGCTIQEIAWALDISVDTTKNHVKSILRKYQIHTRAELVAVWYQQQLREAHAEIRRLEKEIKKR